MVEIPIGQIFHAVLPNKIFIAQSLISPPAGHSWRCFRTAKTLCYHALCDDFGPMTMSSITTFIQMLDAELDSFPMSQIVYCVEPGKKALANSVFLLGTYLILKLDMTSQEVIDCFHWLDPTYVEPFRDATFSESTFDVTLADCWRGFERSKALGWIRLPSSKLPQVWGRINIDEYRQFEDPSNADLHEVVPCKLVAFKGPKDLGDKNFFDDKRGFRHFSPTHYVKLFQSIGVTTVVRLNAAEYDETVFTSNGISHHDLIFDDCTSPPAHIVASFFKIIDSAPGSVAVHCKAGLGRTGTLIALYMMRAYAFPAREAIAWLRIMRPGSVIGQQQHYLCHVERGVRDFQHKIAHHTASPRAARAHMRAGGSGGSGTRSGSSAGSLNAGGGAACQNTPRYPSCPPAFSSAHSGTSPAVAAAAAGSSAQSASSAVMPQCHVLAACPAAASAAAAAAGGGGEGPIISPAAPAALAEQVARGMERRGIARLRAAAGNGGAAGPTAGGAGSSLLLPAIRPAAAPGPAQLTCPGLSFILPPRPSSEALLLPVV